MEPTTEERIRRLLEEGSARLNIYLHQKQKEKLLAYLVFLEKWNKSYNLSAIRDQEEMVSKHLLDSLSVLPILTKEKINTLADVGSGAGFPGAPIAIICPHWQITLIDSNGKKAGFLRQVKTQLLLDNVTIINNRVEAVDQPFDALITRAFSSLKETIEMTAHMLGKNTALWAMKGKFPEEELRELPKPYKVSASHALTVPGCDGERHLLKIIHE